jgi:hypothetical protein
MRAKTKKKSWDASLSEGIGKVLGVIEKVVDLLTILVISVGKLIVKLFFGGLRISGDRATFALLSICGFIAALALAAWQWWEMGGVVHAISLKILAGGGWFGIVSPTFIGSLFGLSLGLYVNYQQLQPRVWRYVRQWSIWKEDQGVDVHYELDEENLTPRDYLAQEANISYRRNQQTSDRFYAAELAVVVVYGVLIVFLGVMPPVLAAFGILRGLLSLKLPEYALKDVQAKLTELFPSKTSQYTDQYTDQYTGRGPTIDI